MKVKSLKKQKKMLYNLFLIRHGFHGFCRKSGTVIFESRVTWNYAYSPFKGTVRVIITSIIKREVNFKKNIFCNVQNNYTLVVHFEVPQKTTSIFPRLKQLFLQDVVFPQQKQVKLYFLMKNIFLMGF